MAIDNFLKLDGIEGEATQRDHRGEIELLSWSWGMSNETPAGGGGGGAGSGRAKAQSLLLVHRYDKASPVLLRFAATGRHVANAALSARRSGAGTRDFLKITLKEKIELGDVVRIEAAPGNVIDSYVHRQDGRGVLGVIVELSGGGTVELAHDIAVHIAFSKPKYLTNDEVPEADVADFVAQDDVEHAYRGLVAQSTQACHNRRRRIQSSRLQHTRHQGHARQRIGRLHQLAVQSHLVDLLADRVFGRLVCVWEQHIRGLVEQLARERGRGD